MCYAVAIESIPLVKGKNDMPKISIIVPVYNVESYLHQCLDSVMAQTFSDFELILIDDGSPDNCGTICDEYAARDSRIRVIHQENAGQGKARNVGMDQAVGKYLIFLDSDDYWLPTTLETLYAEAERNQTQVLAFGANRFQIGKGAPLKKYTHALQDRIVKPGTDSVKTALDTGEYYSEPWCRFYLLEYVRKTGLRFDEGIIHEDARFSFLSHLFADRVECINDQLYQYRARPDSTMGGRSAWDSAHGICVGLNGLLDVYLSHYRSAQEESLIGRYCIVRIRLLCDSYKMAFRQRKGAWQTARHVQQDARQTLRRARAIPSKPWLIRIVTYSLFWGSALTWIMKNTLGKRE